MDREELTRMYELAESEQCKQICSYLTEYIIAQSNTAMDAERIRGMLLILNYIESWKTKYISELAKAQKNRKE